MIISISPTHIETKKSNDGVNHYFFLLEPNEVYRTDHHTIHAWELVYSQKDRYRLPDGIKSEELKTPGEVKALQKSLRENKDIWISFPKDEVLSASILKRYIEDEILPLQDIARRSIRADGSYR